MKKLINSVDTVLSESLDGLVAAHSDILALDEEHRFVRRRRPKSGKVVLISGSGSGHEPLHAGTRRAWHARRRLPGQVFTSPTPDQMVAACEAVAGARDGVHRQELRRRRDEFRHGARDARRQYRDDADR